VFSVKPTVRENIRLLHLFAMKLVLILCLMFVAEASEARPDENRYEFDIHEKTLGAALNKLVLQTGVNVLYPFELAASPGMNPVKGEYSLTEAIDVLFRNTDFSGGLTESGVIVISHSQDAKTHDTEEDVLKTNKTSLLSGVAGIFASLATANAAVDTTEEAIMGLEEVVVTARKVTENLRDVPISAAVMSGKSLEDRGVGTLAESLGAISNVILDTNSAVGANVTIRGISSSTNNVGIEPAVSLFVDEVYMVRPSAYNSVFFDLDRVEVLRGPQSTLLGKNAVGGAISVHTNRPDTEENAFKAIATYGNHDFFQLRGTVNYAVADNFAVRANVAVRRRDGYLENTVGPDAQSEDFAGGRVQLLYAPSEDTAILFSGDYGQDDAIDNSNDVVSGAFAPFDPNDISDRIISVNGDQFTRREVYGASFRVEHDFGSHSFVSLSAYREIDAQIQNDQDFTPLDFFEAGRDETLEFFSQEFRLSSNQDEAFSYLIGVYYANTQTFGRDFARIGPDAYTIFGVPIAAPAGFEENIRTEANISGNAYAIFGSFNYDISEQITLSGGLRYTYEEKDLLYTQELDAFAGAPASFIGLFGVAVPESELDYSDDQLSGDISLNFKVSEEATAYVKFSRGFKAGGFDSTIASTTDISSLVFDSEFVNSYEIGLKADLLDNRMRANFAAYYLDYTDKQEQILDGLQNSTANAATATAYGAELEIQAILAEGLTFSGALGYQSAEYDEYIDVEAGRDFSGNSFTKVPEWTASVAGNYEFDISNDLVGFINAEANFRDESFLSRDNDPANGLQESFIVVNARAGVSSSDGRYTLAVWGRNIFDTEYLLGQTSFLGTTIAQLSAPAFYGVELTVDF